MKLFYSLLPSLFFSLSLQAQGTYVANVANNSNAGTYNTLVGPLAGYSIEGYINTMNANANTFFGYATGYSTTLGGYNTFLGHTAGYFNTTGASNVFVGSGAGYFNTTGDYNTFLGKLAGGYNTTGKNNAFVGISAGIHNSSGYSNVAVGIEANANNSTGNNNVIVGDSAGFNNTVSGNVMLGSKAGYTNSTGTLNTFLGYQAGYNATATANTFIGYRTGSNTTTGQFNTFIGVQAGLNNTTGSSNFIMGTNAGASNTSGSANFFLGDNAGGNNSSGGFNVYLGANAGNGTGVNGNNNVSIGFESGRGNSAGINNTFLGFRADADGFGLSNATAIGNNAKVTQSNSVVLGEGANVGIGISAPANKLHIVGGRAGTAGIRLPISSTSTASLTNQTKFLTVNAQGDVVLGSTNSSGREGVAESLWQRNGSYLESAKGEAIIIGTGVNKTPAGYRLYVQDGILTEKVKVAVKNTGEWSDYVFAPTYRLMPLAEVEQYIKTNQHLPGVPSAIQMVEQGNDLHHTDAKLLEKIEELTLYSIEQEKRTQQLQAEIGELKRLVKQLLENK